MSIGVFRKKVWIPQRVLKIKERGWEGFRRPKDLSISEVRSLASFAMIVFLVLLIIFILHIVLLPSALLRVLKSITVEEQLLIEIASSLMQSGQADAFSDACDRSPKNIGPRNDGSWIPDQVRDYNSTKPRGTLGTRDTLQFAPLLINCL